MHGRKVKRQINYIGSKNKVLLNSIVPTLLQFLKLVWRNRISVVPAPSKKRIKYKKNFYKKF